MPNVEEIKRQDIIQLKETLSLPKDWKVERIEQRAISYFLPSCYMYEWQYRDEEDLTCTPLAILCQVKEKSSSGYLYWHGVRFHPFKKEFIYCSTQFGTEDYELEQSSQAVMSWDDCLKQFDHLAEPILVNQDIFD
jgi:hypothetical protein